jgi:hypothetical protein
MEGKTIKIDNPEAEVFSSIFATRGTVKVSPVDLYDRLEMPEEMRATFEIKPFNPIAYEQMRKINSDAFSFCKKYIVKCGYDYASFVTTLSNLNTAILDYENPIPEDKHEEYDMAVKTRDEMQETWMQGNRERNYNRDNVAAFKLIESHVVSVENLITQDSDGDIVSYSGGVDMEVLYMLPPAMAFWLDKEVQINSKLTDGEITSL